MLLKKVYSLLEFPVIYRLSQRLFGPGAQKGLLSIVKEIAGQLSSHGRILDVGCGPASWLTELELKPFGLDYSYNYSFEFRKNGTAITGSAVELPFRDNSFESVWSIGMFHHLSDSAANLAVIEMLRVCKTDGYVVVLDAVLPEPFLRRPFAYLVRKLDRGKNMRKREELEAILPELSKWNCQRKTYAANGLEVLACCRRLSE